MSQPIQMHFRCLPMPLQQAIAQFVGLPGSQRTAHRLEALVDAHLEAHGMAGDGRRAHYLASAFLIARQRFNVLAERRVACRADRSVAG